MKTNFSVSLSLLFVLLLLPATLRADSVCDAAQSLNITNDSPKDQEPVVTSKNRQVNARTVTAYMKFVDPDRPTIHVKSEATGTAMQLLLPPNTNISGDPAVAFGAAAYANRIYVAGAAYKGGDCFPEPQGCPKPTHIALWYTNDEGLTWTGPRLVVSGDQSTGNYFDKPAIAVSASSNVNQGQVYVASIRDGWLYVSRSSDGGNSFSGPTLVWGGARAFSPQIFVDYFGYVWLAWLEYGALLNAPAANGDICRPEDTPEACAQNRATAHGRIRIARSTDNGATFVEESAPLDAGILLGPEQIACTPSNGRENPVCRLYFLDAIYKSETNRSDYVQARSALSGRFHAGNYYGGIALVWHARERDNIYAPTDVKLVRVSTFGRYPGWYPVITIGHDTTRDQWNPAVEYDDSYYQGWLVSYYDRRLDVSNQLLYRVFMTRMSIDFANLDPCDRLLTSYDSDPKNPAAVPAPNDPDMARKGFRIGEYQGLSYSGGFATAVFTYFTNSQADIHQVREAVWP
ncbi:MAG: sialidase family protein [Thermoanaerobaculia bacterium]